MEKQQTHNQNRGRGGRTQRRSSGRRDSVPSEFQERVLEINRVTRVVKGGKRMRFRALVVLGDKISRVAYGLGKANDVTTAVAKAVNEAKKDIKNIHIVHGTLPYRVQASHKSATVLIKPAKAGTGLIAGGAVRIVLELAGVKDAVAKVLGSSNKISNVVVTIQALDGIQPSADILAHRGKSAKSKSPKSKVEDTK